jgi:malonyl-CoA O-methyltransferase
MNCLPPESLLERHDISQSFDRAAPLYQQHTSLQKSIGENLLERLEWLKLAPEKILDVGAGTGRLTLALSQFYPQAHVYGLDIAHKMLSQAAQNAPPSQPPFIRADAAMLPFANNSIDLLISNLMLQWCNDIEVIFTEFGRVLKPEGALFFSTFGPDTLKELRNSWAAVDQATHVNHFVDMHNIGDALLYAGLTNPVMDVDRLVLSYDDVNGLMKTLKGMGAHNVTAGRSRGLMAKGKFKAMLAAYETYRASDNRLPATFEVVYGHAWGSQTDLLSSSESVAIPISQIRGRKTET